MMAPNARHPWRVALITVTYNSAPVLKDFLSSLDGQTSTDWVLVAVDNASSDDSLEILSSWKGPLHLIANNDNVGFSAATNQGIDWARRNGFDAVMLLNNDTIFGPDFLEKLLIFQNKNMAKIVSPVIKYADNAKRYWFSDGGFTYIRGGFQAWMGENSRNEEYWYADFAPGCALLIENSIFDLVGNFDEQFFVYWEDVDFCIRCKNAGIKILVVKNPEIYHKVSSITGANSPFSIRMYQKNQILLIRKHFGIKMTFLQIPLIIMKVIIRRLFKLDNSQNYKIRIKAILDEMKYII
jgi:GT2 family glycosyltransferase